MQVHHGTDNLNIHNAVATIGSFDGVHLGHRSVLKNLKDVATRMHGESVIISFDPHPREVLYPNEKAPGLLTTLGEKEYILNKIGIDHLILLPFTKELGNLTYLEFVQNILVTDIKVKALVVGYDHRFGKNREGNFDSLKILAKQFGFYLEQEKVYTDNDINVSSTKIRTALELGDVVLAKRFLGYNYSLAGKIVHGKGFGNTIGFPTANIELDDKRKLLPANGVYAVDVKIDDIFYKGMLNIGTRPTVDNSGNISIEVNIFDFNANLYGKHIVVSLLFRERGESKFQTTQDLQTQLTNDRRSIMGKLK